MVELVAAVPSLFAALSSHAQSTQISMDWHKRLEQALLPSAQHQCPARALKHVEQVTKSQVKVSVAGAVANTDFSVLSRRIPFPFAIEGLEPAAQGQGRLVNPDHKSVA